MIYNKIKLFNDNKFSKLFVENDDLIYENNDNKDKIVVEKMLKKYENNIIIFECFKDFIDAINENNDLNGKMVYLKNYYKDQKNAGGFGFFKYEKDIDRKFHDGGISIDPTIPYPDEINNKNLYNYFWNNGKKNRTKGLWIRLTDESLVNVKWFGAKGDGINDDIESILQSIAATKGDGGYYLKFRNTFSGIFFPPGRYRITKSILTDYMGYIENEKDYIQYFTRCDIVGSGMSFDAGNMGLGTMIVADFNTGPAILVTGDRSSRFFNFQILGKNFKHIDDNELGYTNYKLDFRVADNWVDPEIKEAGGDNDETLYAGIAVDNKCFGKNIDSIGTSMSSNLDIDRVNIMGFVDGVALAPCGTTGNCDFMKFHRGIIMYCKNAMSLGHTQLRNTVLRDSIIHQVHTVIKGDERGYGSGKMHLDISNTSADVSYQIITANPPLGMPTFDNFYCENMYRIGDIHGSSAGKKALIFNNCELNLGTMLINEFPKEECLIGENITVKFIGGQIHTYDKCSLIDRNDHNSGYNFDNNPNFRINGLSFGHSINVHLENTVCYAIKPDKDNPDDLDKLIYQFNPSGIFSLNITENSAHNPANYRQYIGYKNQYNEGGRDNIVYIGSYYKLRNGKIKRLNVDAVYLDTGVDERIDNYEVKDSVLKIIISYEKYRFLKYDLDVGDICYMRDYKSYGFVKSCKYLNDKKYEVQIVLMSNVNPDGLPIYNDELNDYIVFNVNRHYMLNYSYVLEVEKGSDIIKAYRTIDFYSGNVEKDFHVNDFILAEQIFTAEDNPPKILELNKNDGTIKIDQKAKVSTTTTVDLCIRSSLPKFY